MAKQTIAQRRFNLSNPKVLIPVIFVLGFAIFGVYMVLSSSAATFNPIYTSYGDYEDVELRPSAGVSTYNDGASTYGTTVQAVGNKVTKISAGGTATYTDHSNPHIYEKQVCYTIRPADGETSNATVDLYGQMNTRRVVIRTDAPGYREFCVSRGTTANGDKYQVKHVSGGSVLVSNLSMTYTMCPATNSWCD